MYEQRSASGNFFCSVHDTVREIPPGRTAFPGPDMMQDRLQAEGVPVENHRVLNFEKYFWDPAIALGDEVELA